MPLTAAITGLFSSSIEVNRLRMVKMYSLTFSGDKVARSFKSAPEQKALSPAPVTMMTRISRRKRKLSIVSRNANSRGKFSEFMTSGRFKVR
jgi:hypothetical protein